MWFDAETAPGIGLSNSPASPQEHVYSQGFFAWPAHVPPSVRAGRAGPAGVYAVESGNVIDVAREAAAANGFADRIRFIQAVSTAVDLPERVDGFVSDLHGVLPLYRKAVVSILDARDRFLKPGGWMIPARETIWAAVLTSASAHARVVGAWNTEYGFDLSAARRRATNLYQGRRIKAADLLSAPQCWATLEYETLREPGIGGHVSYTVERDGLGHGVAMWFDAETAPDIGFSNSPASREEHVYSQGFFAWPEAVPLSGGDIVRLRVRADFVGEDYVWTWNTDIAGPAPSAVVKVSYQQSSFFGGTAASESWRRRADTFVANLNDDSRIDREILKLMERKRPLGEVATEILTAFPSAFKDWNAALGRVGMLSDRYSR